ncbi:MAG: class I SAM-dependent methyltransferase [Candidatus Eremiobacteraeota bacterium]|nr:class I SAM-dependent methyltransferase [Candidatus Eremiobacteraeota bacterium]
MDQNSAPVPVNQRIQTKVQVEVGIDVTFPLPDGRMLAQGPLTYNFDGLATNHNADFMAEPRFQRATEAGWATGHRFPFPVEIWWRIHFMCWSAQHALKIGGDFIEFGVHTGIFSKSIAEYIGFENYPSTRLYLLDTFEGIPTGDLSADEVARGTLEQNKEYYFDCYSQVVENFAKYPNAKIIKGRVPDTLTQIDSERFGYCSIDMNNAFAEMSAGRWVWEKLIPGAMIVLDDYGYNEQYVNQRRAWDDLGRELGFAVLALPTGQGLIVKP